MRSIIFVLFISGCASVSSQNKDGKYELSVLDKGSWHFAIRSKGVALRKDF